MSTNDSVVLRVFIRGFIKFFRLIFTNMNILNFKKQLFLRTSDERQLIKEAFEEKYGEPLIEKIKAELGGAFEEAVVALMDVRVIIFKHL